MARATPQEWQQNLNWNPNNMSGDPSIRGNQGGRNDQAMYENYSREYDRIAATGNQSELRILNNAHGFYPGVAQGEGPSGHHAPKGKGGGGGGAEMAAFQSMFADMMAKYDTLLSAFLDKDAESASQPDGGMGFEDTILTRRVLDDDEISKPGLTPSYGQVQRRVVDPVTGATYPSPQAAVAAGVTNWTYMELS